MDAKKVGVHFTSGLILLVFIAGWIVCTQTAGAQSGTCPDWTSAITPSPPGNWPASMAPCAESSTAHRVTTVYGGQYPCGGGLQIDAWDTTNQGQPTIYLVPPSSQTFPSARARIRWQMSAERWAISQYQIEVTAQSFDANDNQIGNVVLFMEAYPVTIDQFGQKTYAIEIGIPFVQNGYVTVEVTDPVGPFYSYDVFLFGFKLMDADQWPPLDYCMIDGQLPPTITPTPSATPLPTPEPTNTPTPSNTPTGTPPNTPTPSNTPDNTPTRTPSPTPQSYPTAAGGTPSPFPTRTPPTVPTVAAPRTPTRLPVVNFPAVSFPGVSVPTFSAPSIAEIGTSEPFDMALTPNATLQADQTRIASLNLESQAIISRWYTATDWASSMFSLTITNTTGLSSVVEIAGVMSESIVVPFTYVRAVRQYVPNLWPLILFLLLGTGWVLFTLLIKWVIPIITFIFDLIKKLPFA